MRRLSMLLVLASVAGACNDDEDHLAVDASTAADAATPDAATSLDGGAGDASTVRSRLPRPGLEHAPTSLPDDLKPPARP